MAAVLRRAAADRAADAVDHLAGALPAGRVVRDPTVLAGYRSDQETAEWGEPAAVVRPVSTAEVATVVRTARQFGVPIVPRGAGSGLTGGANAVEGCIVLCLERMRRIKQVDTVERYAVVEPGVVNQELRVEVARHGLWYPPDPSSRDFCTLGGNVATNAGGLCCVRYGVTKDYVLALEVVTGAGDVLRLGHRTAKGVVGLDLASLFVGSEGSLGVVTEITLRLRPQPGEAVTVAAAFSSELTGVAAVLELRRSGVEVEICELMDRRTVDAVEEVSPLGLPADRAAVLLVQVQGLEAGIRTEQVLTESGASWTGRSETAQEGEALFAARRRAFDALRRQGTITTEDVCVPLASLGPVMMAIAEIGARRGVDVATVAHAGDGNLHPMIVDDGTADPAAVAQAFDDIIEVALSHGGTVSGEHGVGLLKRAAGIRELGDPVVDLATRIKAVLDPDWIMNPGKGAFHETITRPHPAGLVSMRSGS